MRKVKILLVVITVLLLVLAVLPHKIEAYSRVAVKIITTCPLPDGEIGIPYSVTLQSDGTVDLLNWYIPVGTLPPGLSIDNKTGVISGTPTKAGKFSFTITLSDAQQNKDGPYQCSITINQTTPDTPTITISPTKTITPTPFDFSIDAVNDVVVLDINQPLQPGTNRYEAEQKIETILISGITQSGQFYFSGVPEGVEVECGVMAGSPAFSSDCTFFITDIETTPLEGDYPVEVIMNINNLVRSDLFTLRFPLLQDLKILAVKPVQVVYDADLHGMTTLVKGKGTAFKVVIDSTYLTPIDIELMLTLPEEEWYTAPPSTGNFIQGVPAGWSYPDTWGPVTINPGENEIILPYLPPDQITTLFTENLNQPGLIEGVCVGNICGPDVRVMPRPDIIGTVHYQVVVDPGNSLSERYTSNNEYSGTAHSIGTRPWKFYVVPYRDVGGDCAPNIEDVQNGAKHMLEFLLAINPIADSELKYSIAPLTTIIPCASNPSESCGYADSWESRSDDYAGFLSRGEYLNEISTLALSEGYDFAIGMGCGCGGGASGGVNAFVVGNCGGDYSYKMAHEFNHVVANMWGDIYSLDCLVGWDEAYCEQPDGTREYYCYEDSLDKRDGFSSINCTFDSYILECLPDQVKNCVGSCNCSKYDFRWESYPVCPALGICNAGCCRGIASAGCSGRVYNGPDGRIFHPASEGFWVNRYLPVTENAVYIMDSYSPATSDPVKVWMRLENTYSHCYEDRIFNDGYLNLLRNPRFLDSVDPETLLVSGEIHADGSALFNPFLRMISQNLELPSSDEESYRIVLLNAESDVLESISFDPVFYQTDPEEGVTDTAFFSYRVQWMEGTQKIELRNPAGTTIAERELSVNPPKVEITNPEPGVSIPGGSPIIIKWTGTDADEDQLSYFISISIDETESWQPVAGFLVENQYKLDTASFPVDTDLLIKIRATDGVNTAYSILSSPIRITEAKITLPKNINYPLLVGVIILWAVGVCALIWIIIKNFVKRRR